MEKVPAGGRVSVLNPDHLKPMRKRKRKEYLSPSEEDSDLEGPVRQTHSDSFRKLFMNKTKQINKMESSFREH